MAEPWTFDFEPQNQVFTFVNDDHVTFTVDTQFAGFPPESVTVESVKIDTPGHSVDLPITDFAVPPPVVEHLSGHFFDLLI